VRVLHRALRGLLDAKTVSNFMYFALTEVDTGATGDSLSTSRKKLRENASIAW
jgi:hypothetical protein